MCANNTTNNNNNTNSSLKCLIKISNFSQLIAMSLYLTEMALMTINSLLNGANRPEHTKR